jgi:hypothetical protein
LTGRIAVSNLNRMVRILAGTGLRAGITAAQLHALYIAQKLPISEVAAKLGVAPTTIFRRLHDLEIPTRKRGPSPSFERRFEWTADLAYVVGLIATDGCLSRDGRHLAITSKDWDLLETAKRCLGATVRITRSTNPRPCYRLQWGDVVFYQWLSEVGLMPAKSLQLGPLRIPDEWFRDFLRGCIDGDGSIHTYVDRYNTSKDPAYVYIRVYVSVVSASPAFIEWLRASTRRLAQVSGDVGLRRSPGRHDVWRLRYAKRESLALLRWIYYTPNVACLRRKRDRAEPFLCQTAMGAAVRRPGRPMVV